MKADPVPLAGSVTRAVQQISDTLKDGVWSLRVDHCVRRVLEDAVFRT